MDPAVFADLVDPGNVGMVEAGQHLGLPLETRQPVGVERERFGQHLDRDVPAELRVLGAVDLAHSAFAELGGNPKVQQGAVGLDSQR